MKGKIILKIQLVDLNYSKQFKVIILSSETGKWTFPPGIGDVGSRRKMNVGLTSPMNLLH